MNTAPPHSLSAELVEVVVHALERTHSHLHLHLLADLARPIDRDVLVEAFRDLVAAFPVLGCSYQPGWWRDHWVPWRGELASLVHVERPDDIEEATLRWAQEPMRYLDEPTVRVAFFEGEQGGRLILSMHHMVADGGGIKAAGAVLVARLCGTEPDQLPSDDRSLMNVARCLRGGDLPVLAREMVREGLLPISMLRIRRLDHGMPSGGLASGPCWRPVLVAGQTTASLVAGCKRRGATINDALVATVARLGSRRSDRGPVVVAYTVDLRRYLRERRAQVTNLAGVSMVVLERSATASASAAVEAVSSAIGEQKRRLTGLAYALLPGFTVGWLPHGLLRRVGTLVIDQILRRFDRCIAITNIGSLDEPLAPFGDDALAASIVGPFVRGVPPLITATGFRGALTLQVVANGLHAPEHLEAFAEELEEALLELAKN